MGMTSQSGHENSTDLPDDQAEDLNYELGAAIEATKKEEPKKQRVIDKLTAMQLILDSLKNSTVSAINLG